VQRTRTSGKVFDTYFSTGPVGYGNFSEGSNANAMQIHLFGTGPRTTGLTSIADKVALSGARRNGASASIYYNGRNDTASTAAQSIDTTNLRIGDNIWPIGADIAEMIIYRAALDDTAGNDLHKINSYLALKYGITLDSTRDYLASDGTIVYPSLTTHSAYTHDIAGIGIDDTSSLTQLTSRSVNTDSIVTMTGTLASIINGEFLVWGNDNGGLTLSTEIPPTSPSPQRFTREWRVAETGEVGNVTISFDLGAASGVVDFSRPNDFGLLIDSDGDFSDASVTGGATVNGSVVTFSGVNFANGDYFSLAYPSLSNLAISKSVSPASAAPGQEITYTVTFSNTGSGVATNVILTDVIPVSLTAASVTSSGVAITDTGANPSFVWDVQNLVPGQGGRITITARISPNLSSNTSFSNSATITGTGDLTPSNNTASAGVTVNVPTIAFSNAAYSVNEGAGQAVITVSLSAAPFGPVTVNYATSDNTATAGSDYSASSGTVTVLTGTTSATFTIPITDDTLDENNETVTVT
jgi:uncharacterized repeat protein (TIGR01451 family)